jgi:hypothetical protein
MRGKRHPALLLVYNAMNANLVHRQLSASNGVMDIWTIGVSNRSLSTTFTGTLLCIQIVGAMIS